MSVARRSLPRRDAGHKRVMAIATSVVFAFLVLIGQLWYLQVLEGGRFLDASDKNRIRVRPIAAPRGILFDRHGMPLVDNRPAFTLSFIPRELPRDEESRDAVLGRVASLLHIPYQDLTDAVARVPADSLLPVRVRRGLTLADVAKVEEWKLELPGVITEVEPQRVYATSRFTAHLLGYVREANDEQLKQGDTGGARWSARAASSASSTSTCAVRTAASGSRSTRWAARSVGCSRPSRMLGRR